MKKRGCGLDRSYRGGEGRETDLDSVQFLDVVRPVGLVQSGSDVDACIRYPTSQACSCAFEVLGTTPVNVHTVQERSYA